MAKRSPEWLERIENVAGELTPVYVDPLGNRRYGTLDEAQARMNAPKWKPIRGARIQLSDIEKANPNIYLKNTGFAQAEVGGHEIFEFTTGGYVVHAPAAMLIHALLGGRLTGFGRFLLTANGLSQAAIPILNPNGMSVRMSRKTEIERAYQEAPAFQSYMSWVVSHASARRMWASVYLHALDGRLALDFPLAEVICNITGIVRGGMLFAMRISISTLHTRETPLPFAMGRLSSPPFNFRPGIFDSKYMWGRPQPTIRDEKLVTGAEGYELTTAEWELLRGRFTLGRTGKSTLDRLLVKLGSGKPWEKSPATRAAQRLWRSLQARDQWTALREAINTIRG